MTNAIEVLKEVSLELKNGTLGKDLELGHIEQLLEIGIYKLQKKGYFKNKKALLALEQKEDDRKQGAIEQKEKDKIDFIRLEVIPKSKKNQFRVFFKDGTEQVFQMNRVGEQK